MGRLGHALTPVFPEATFEDAVLQWEAELEKYEKTSGVPLQDQVKTAAVLNALTGAIERLV